jgi:hypothetical protein
MKRLAPCQGAIKRSYGEFPCGAGAAYAVRNNDTDAVRGACRHHLAQVIDSMEATSVLVVVPGYHPVPVDRSTVLTNPGRSE